MILCVCGKKIKAKHSFDVTSVLTKCIIIFYWWIIVGMMMVTEKLPKIFVRTFCFIFSWVGDSIHTPQIWHMKMTTYIKDPHTAIFTAPTSCGKIHLVLDLIEKEHSKHYNSIIIICPTLRRNKTYHDKGCI